MCRERDSNPHDRFGSRDFKSLVSTNSTIAARFQCAKVRLIPETAKYFINYLGASRFFCYLCTQI